jgi:superkiller protein 8
MVGPDFSPLELCDKKKKKLTYLPVETIPDHPYSGQWFVLRPHSPPSTPRASLADANVSLAAHTTDIFSLAATTNILFSASGSSTINLHRITDASGTFPISQSLSAHKLGCHHVATAPRGSNGTVAASVGFGGDIKIWRSNPDSGDFSLDYEITPAEAKTKGVSDSWAVALSCDENYMACTTHDGKIHVWDLQSKNVVQTYETGGGGNGSFALSVDLSADGRLTASGHQNGSVYVFNNDAGHLKYSLSGQLPCHSRTWLS